MHNSATHASSDIGPRLMFATNLEAEDLAKDDMYTNDGTSRKAYLRFGLNLASISDLPPTSSLRQNASPTWMSVVRDSGFVDLQGTDEELSQAPGFGKAGMTRVDKPGDAFRAAQRGVNHGYSCLTLHVGSGLEDDHTADALVQEVIDASHESGLPMYIETHRATVTQDPWRTVRLVERNPQIRFNGDFSHWYVGAELVYGDFERKLEFLQPVFDRVRFLHGRIANPGSIQVSVVTQESAKCVEDFIEMWSRAFQGFLAGASSGDYISFMPELLSPKNFYARTFFDAASSSMQEESDRWAECLALTEIAAAAFDKAQLSTGNAAESGNPLN